MTSFNLNYLLKALFPNTFTLEIKALTYGLGRGEHNSFHSILSLASIIHILITRKIHFPNLIDPKLESDMEQQTGSK